MFRFNLQQNQSNSSSESGYNDESDDDDDSALVYGAGYGNNNNNNNNNPSFALVVEMWQSFSLTCFALVPHLFWHFYCFTVLLLRECTACSFDQS
jgi:hypothetical protein